MTVLSACQDAAKLLKPAQAVPTAIIGSTDTFAVELAALSNEAAKAIAKHHDWRKLITLKTQTGDGSTTAFSLPTDYDRMPVKASVFSSSYQQPLEPVQDLDIWLDREIRSFVGSIGYWMILSGYMNIKPTMSVSQSAKYYYVSSYYAADSNSAAKAAFTADTDTFRLPERLLTLALIWRWRHRKGLDYAEDMQNFEIAQSEAIARDKGSRILAVGRARMPADTVATFPGTVSA